jgi:hypothetical protein
MNAYIVEAVRTAGGRRAAKLADWHPADMAAEVFNALVDRCGIDPGAIEDVIFGCVSQIGEQSFHIGRNAVLASRLPESVPAVSTDRQCGSSPARSPFRSAGGHVGHPRRRDCCRRREHESRSNGYADKPRIESRIRRPME